MELIRAERTIRDLLDSTYSAVTYHELYQIAARAAIDPIAARSRRKAAGAAWARLNSQLKRQRQQK